MTFPYQVRSCFVSGHLTYHEGVFNEAEKGHRLQFDRA